MIKRTLCAIALAATGLSGGCNSMPSTSNVPTHTQLAPMQTQVKQAPVDFSLQRRRQPNYSRTGVQFAFYELRRNPDGRLLAPLLIITNANPDDAQFDKYVTSGILIVTKTDSDDEEFDEYVTPSNRDWFGISQKLSPHKNSVYMPQRAFSQYIEGNLPELDGAIHRIFIRRPMDPLSDFYTAIEAVNGRTHQEPSLNLDRLDAYVPQTKK